MTFVFSKEKYETLKSADLSALDQIIVFDDLDCSIKITSPRELLIAINDEIACKGMNDDYSQPNEYGAKLYEIYDEILSQRDAAQ